MKRSIPLRIAALFLTVGLSLPAPAFGLRLPLEEAAVGPGVVVIDAAALEENPALQAVVSRFSDLAPNVVIFGDSPAARETAAANPELSWARTGQEWVEVLVGLEEKRGIRSVTFLGSADWADRVRPVIQEVGLTMISTLPSLPKLLAAFIPGPLAAELAAGLEEQATLGIQA